MFNWGPTILFARPTKGPAWTHNNNQQHSPILSCTIYCSTRIIHVSGKNEIMVSKWGINLHSGFRRRTPYWCKSGLSCRQWQWGPHHCTMATPPTYSLSFEARGRLAKRSICKCTSSLSAYSVAVSLFRTKFGTFKTFKPFNRTLANLDLLLDSLLLLSVFCSRKLKETVTRSFFS
jgi:hypothetical protein